MKVNPKINPMTDDDILEKQLFRELWMDEKARLAQLKASPLAVLHALLTDIYGDAHDWGKAKELWISLAEIGADHLMKQGKAGEFGVLPTIVLDGAGVWMGVVPDGLDKGKDAAYTS